jgi:hypothetical protein
VRNNIWPEASLIKQIHVHTIKGHDKKYVIVTSLIKQIHVHTIKGHDRKYVIVTVAVVTSLIKQIHVHTIKGHDRKYVIVTVVPSLSHFCSFYTLFNLNMHKIFATGRLATTNHSIQKIVISLI